MRRAVIVWCILSSLLTNAQVGGESVFQFLNLPTSAAQIGLGGETLTLTNDINQPIFNPATVSGEMNGMFSVDYTNYLSGISIGSFSYARKMNRKWGTFHGSIKYLNYGTFIGADEQGNETGNFGASDLAVSVGYAKELPIANLYVGANVKLISATIATFNAIGIASDVAILYNHPYQPYKFTLVARNIGAQLKSYNGLRENLPFKLAFGASYRLAYVPLRWHLTLDNLQQWDLSEPNPSNQTTDLEGNTTEEKISFLGNAMRHVIIGAELFPDSVINLRVGYNFKRANELALQNLRSFSGFSLGFGINMKRFKFNYAFSKVHAAANVSTFGLVFNVNTRKRW